MENQPTIKKILYVGSRDNDLVKSIRTIFEGKPDVVVSVMERADINEMDTRTKLKVIKWQEKQKMHDFINNPINIKMATKKGEDLYQHLKEYKAIQEFRNTMATQTTPEGEMSRLQLEAIRDHCRNNWNGWFIIKDVVEATTLSYKGGKELLDTLYAFGFCAFREYEGQTQYMLLLSPHMQRDYINLLYAEKMEELKMLMGMLDNANEKVQTYEAEQLAKAETLATPTLSEAENSDTKPVKKTRKKVAKAEEGVEK